MLGAVPAALAAVWSTNEVTSTFELTQCLAKISGADSTNFASGTDFKIAFDNATTQVDPVTGAVMLQETLTVRAPAGFRTTSTDTFRVAATDCGRDFSVHLTATPTNAFGETALAGNWADKGLQIYLAHSAAPATDFGTVADWDQAPLLISDEAVANASTGVATLADNGELSVGFRLSGGAPAGAAGTFRFQVQFVPNP